MFTIKITFFTVIVLLLSSGCSHRFPKSAYFHKSKNKHEVHTNNFDPDEADKSKKVRLDDEDVINGEEPVAKADQISQKDLKHPTMNSYKVNGKRYRPSVVEVGEEFDGVASWYGPDFNGKKTSNGETYDMYAFTAAHKTLPMNTVVRVTHLDNLRQVTVRVNDRGPFVKNRIIDLSKAAARAIEMTDLGTAPVRIEILGFSKDLKTGGSYKKPVSSGYKEHKRIGNFYVQIGSFRNFDGAKRYQERYTKLGERYGTIIKTAQVRGDTVYKVALSGFSSEEEARNYIEENSGFENAFIIRD